MLGIFRTPPRAWKLHALLHQIAVGTFNLARADWQALADGAGKSKLILALTEVTPAPTHRCQLLRRIWWLQIGLQLVEQGIEPIGLEALFL